MFIEVPRLYEIAKQITLDRGFPYTDPRTGRTTHPEKKRKTKRRKAKRPTRSGR